MSIGSDSQVVEALQQGYNLERLLQQLGCDTRKDNGAAFESAGGFIHCPMPDHADANESCSVIASGGFFECRSLCGTIRPMDLVIAHGHATDRGDAAKFIEKALGIEPGPKVPPVPILEDPSLTVAQYLASKGLPDWIAAKFGLEDVQIHQKGITFEADGTTVKEHVKNTCFETGRYPAVFMPTRPGRRPRVRCSVPPGNKNTAKVKWAPKVWHADRFMDYSVDRSQPGPAREWPQDLCGMAQLEPAPAGAPRVLMIVEGESDTHAMHAMKMPFVAGVPGTKMVKRLRSELLEAALLASTDPETGEQRIGDLVVVIWQEPGSAGGNFPKDVAATITDVALESGYPSPSFVTLHHGALPGSPKDPASLLSDLPSPEVAAQRMHDAIMAVLPSATVAAQVAQTPRDVAELRHGAQVAIDVLQPNGEHTPPPATVETDTGVAPVRHEGDTPAAPQHPAVPVVYDIAGNPVNVPSPVYHDSAPQRGSDVPLWEGFEELDAAPERDLAPASVEGFNCTFYRSAEGWTVEKVDKDGDSTFVTICSAFVVEQVERCSGEMLVRIAAPFGGAWNRSRFSLGDTADAGRTCAQLATIGVLIANRQRSAVTDLLLSLARDREAAAGAVSVPAGTGWSGRPGTSDFGGIDVEPVNDFGARMFEANQRRRKRQSDTLAAALQWWNEGAMPLLSAQETPTASGAAPLLALGAAAAAPLIGPLSEAGVSVAPVVWIAGLGGGGKSVTQTLAATIFAPKLPDLDGQIAYFANANISQAALSARVDSCRDLPLILDDVTQLPPSPSSTSRGDAARIEAAAALGMLVFNRKPIERATRDGGIRQTRAFRSTAIFSAEVNMSSESSKAVVTAGQRRRIATIEARPMTERGLGQAYAETVNDLAATVGGAPGELLVARIRDVVSKMELRGLYEDVRGRIMAMPEAAEVERTQRESMAINVLGFALLAQSLGFDYASTVTWALSIIAPYMEAGAGAGGATKDSELTGVEAALRAVEECFAAHPTRFDRSMHDHADYSVMPPLQGYLGKQISSLADGSRRIVMLRPGMEMLNSRYGVTMQVIEQAQAEGRCKQRHQFRMSGGDRVHGTLWILPPASPETDEPDEDPTLPAPHDTDPHGLAQPVESPALHVPGAGIAYQEEVNMGLLTAVSTHGYEVPAHIRDYLDTLIRKDAAKFVFESGRDAMLHAYSTGEGTRTINHQEGDIVTDFRYAWGAGLYIVGDAESMRSNQSLFVTIRNDVAEELAALRGHYQAAAEADPEGVLGTPIEVADFPEWEDPRWAKIDGLGQDRARAQWKAHFEALWRANHSETPEESRANHEKHVKHYRIHLMSRYRHPEWFITDAQELA